MCAARGRASASWAWEVHTAEGKERSGVSLYRPGVADEIAIDQAREARRRRTQGFVSLILRAARQRLTSLAPLTAQELDVHVPTRDRRIEADLSDAELLVDLEVGVWRE